MHPHSGQSLTLVPLISLSDSPEQYGQLLYSDSSYTLSQYGHICIIITLPYIEIIPHYLRKTIEQTYSAPTEMYPVSDTTAEAKNFAEPKDAKLNTEEGTFRFRPTASFLR